MFGKKDLGMTVLGGAIVAAGSVQACGSRSSLSDGMNSDTVVTTDSGTDNTSETGTGGNAGSGGEAGVGGVAGEGGQGGAGGEGGAINCTLLKDYHVSPNPFDPTKGEVAHLFYEVTQPVDQLRVQILDQANSTLDTVLDATMVGPGFQHQMWDGKNQMDTLVDNGFYEARLVAKTTVCEDVRTVLVEVNKQFNECVLTVEESPTKTDFSVPQGSANVKTGCYVFKSSNCILAVNSLALENVATGDQVNSLLNNNLRIQDYIISETKNFNAQTGNITFDHALSINLQMNQQVEVCLHSEVAGDAAGQPFDTVISSADDLVVYSFGTALPIGQIQGDFPIHGNSVLVSQ